MTTFRFHTRVPAPPEQVWAVLTDVSTIPDWFPGVLHASFDGSHRILKIANGATLRALIVTKDDALRRFQYRFVDGMPEDIQYHLGTLDVLPDDAGSLVIYSQEILPDSLAPHVGPAVEGGIGGIARYFTPSAPPASSASTARSGG
jgi:hypothetical protein